MVKDTMLLLAVMGVKVTDLEINYKLQKVIKTLEQMH